MLKDHILYLNEWRNSTGNPKALPDLTTKNVHFLQFCFKVLKRKGIKNFLFPLALRDQTLKGIDPHTLNDETDPTGELRNRVGLECNKNIWYFLREVVRFAGPQGPTFMKFNRANCAMVWCFMQGIDYIAIQPRQTGKTTLALILTVWALYIGASNFKMGMIAKDLGLKKKNLDQLRSIRDLLPKYLIVQKNAGKDNSDEISYLPLNNFYYTFVAKENEGDANGLARGYTFSTLQIDEQSFCKNIKISLDSLASTLREARALATAADMPRSTLYTTTAGDPNLKEGNDTLKIVTSAFRMTEKLYDFESREQVREFLDNNSTNGAINGTYSHLQLGFTNEWLLNFIRKHNLDMDTILRDYLNRWYSGARKPIIPQDVVKRIRRSAAPDGPLHQEIIDGYCVSWYIPPDEVSSWENKSFIAGLDASEMVEGDFTTMVAIDPKNLRTLFTFRCNNSNIVKLARFITEVMMKYRKMVLVPEAKSSGRSIMDAIEENLLAKGISPFTRIFNYVIQNHNDSRFKNMDYRDITLYENGGRKHLGFMTTSQSRNTLYKDVLQKAARLSADKILDQVLIDELISLEVKNGRIDHGNGKHDDMVIAWLLANWLIFFGNNLKCYGLDISQIDNLVASNDNSITETQVKKELALRQQYLDTKKLMEMTYDPIMKDRYRQELNVIKSQMGSDISLEPISQEISRKGGYNLKDQKYDQNRISTLVGVRLVANYL